MCPHIERVISWPDLGDAAWDKERLRFLTRHRGYGTRTEPFEGFPHDVRWRWMAVTPAGLAAVRYIGYDYWVELSGRPRLPVDAARCIRPTGSPGGLRGRIGRGRR